MGMFDHFAECDSCRLKRGDFGCEKMGQRRLGLFGYVGEWVHEWVLLLQGRFPGTNVIYCANFGASAALSPRGK